ncbi:MAG: hypothetical protein COU26_04015 [Candidatus Levybacteria bacterium CG10_big_fil_rev_8_21_14_0_10_36_30]|nr:MAG: hypothetical protein COU26_04015 [Candidatus Levybacteria bacterium CG10_big_fil_rev_8_21_14_0_10_36_30]
MNTYVSLSSLAMDLKRVAIGYHRGSEKMADRFLEEVLKRKDEIQKDSVKPYVNLLLSKLEGLLNEKDLNKKAEDSLLYSTLFQNASLAI